MDIPVRVKDERFNGAALKWARKSGWYVAPQRGQLALQRSRAQVSAEMTSPARMWTRLIWLQRSRAQVSAEIPPAINLADITLKCFNGAALKLSAEIVSARCHFDLPCDASTEPRSSERGNFNHTHYAGCPFDCFNGAALK